MMYCPASGDCARTAFSKSDTFSVSAGARLRTRFHGLSLAIEEPPPSPFTSILLWSLVALLLVAIAWAWLSHLPIMTTAPGKFANDAHTKVVQSLNIGTVQNIQVKVGDTVSKGQVLVTLDPGVDLTKLASTRQDLGLNGLEQQRVLSELGLRPSLGPIAGVTRAAVSLEKHLAASQLASQRGKIEVDQAEVDEARANLAVGRATLAEYVQRTAQDTALAQAAKPLVAEGALSGERYTQLQDQVIVDEGQLRAQRQQVEQLAAAIIAAQKQREEDTRELESDRYQDLESSVGKGYDLTSQYAQATRDAALDQLRTPVSGSVQSVDVASLGTVVQAGQTVATIVPSDTPLIVEVDLPAQDVGFVKVGEKTQIKVTAYPFEQYGSIRGNVLSVSPTADPTSDLSSLPEGEDHQPVTPSSQNVSPPNADQTKGPSPPTLYYRVKVRPEQVWLDVEGQRRTMRPGMTVSVDIETGRRRVLDFFLDPVMKYMSNGLTTR
jgi:hemolysin D